MRFERPILTAILTLAFALPAEAREKAGEYGSAGQLEAGGSFGIASVRDEFDSGDSTSLAIVVNPQVGYFVADGFELIGALGLVSVSQTDDDGAGGESDISATQIGLGAGAGYFLKVGGARLGPQLLLQFVQLDGSLDIAGFGEVDVKNQDIGMSASFQAKVPVGGGGVITAGIGAQFANVTQEVSFGALSADSDGTSFGIETSVGFLVFF